MEWVPHKTLSPHFKHIITHTHTDIHTYKLPVFWELSEFVQQKISCLETEQRAKIKRISTQHQRQINIKINMESLNINIAHACSFVNQHIILVYYYNNSFSSSNATQKNCVYEKSWIFSYNKLLECIEKLLILQKHCCIF